MVDIRTISTGAISPVFKPDDGGGIPPTTTSLPSHGGSKIDRNSSGKLNDYKLRNQLALQQRRQLALTNMKSAAQTAATEASKLPTLDGTSKEALKSHASWNADSNPTEVLNQARQMQTVLKNAGMSGKALDDLDTAVKSYESAQTPLNINTTLKSPLPPPTSSTSSTPLSPLSPNSIKTLTDDMRGGLNGFLEDVQTISPPAGAGTSSAQLQSSLKASVEKMLAEGGHLLSPDEKKSLETHLKKLNGTGSAAPTEKELSEIHAATKGQVQKFAIKIRESLEADIKKLPEQNQKTVREGCKNELALLDDLAKGKQLYQPPPSLPPPDSSVPPSNLNKPLPAISPEDQAHKMELESLEKQKQQITEVAASQRFLQVLETMFAMEKKVRDFIMQHLI